MGVNNYCKQRHHTLDRTIIASSPGHSQFFNVVRSLTCAVLGGRQEKGVVWTEGCAVDWTTVTRELTDICTGAGHREDKINAASMSLIITHMHTHTHIPEQSTTYMYMYMYYLKSISRSMISSTIHNSNHHHMCTCKNTYIIITKTTHNI